jgi:hypothetical protein
MISPASRLIEFSMKNKDYFQCVTGQVGIVVNTISLQSLTSKEPANAFKIPALPARISKLLVKPWLSRGFLIFLLVKSTATIFVGSSDRRN